MAKSSTFEDLLIALAWEHERRISEVRDNAVKSKIAVEVTERVKHSFRHQDVPGTRETLPSGTAPKDGRLNENGALRIAANERISKISAGSQRSLEIPTSPTSLTSAISGRLTRHSTKSNTSLGRKSHLLELRGTELIEFEQDHQYLSSVVKNLITLYQTWRELEEPERVGFFSRIVSGQYFSFLCMAVILADSMFNVYTSERQMATLDPGPSKETMYVELGFLGFYVLELVLKFAVHRWYFFCNGDCAWNLFDFCLVIQAVINTILFFASKDQSDSLIFVRVLRLFKFGKIFRMFRALKFLRELRVMVMTIVGSIITLFWSLVTLTLILYIFALVFIQEMSEYLIELKQNGTLDSAEEELVRKQFDTVAIAMLHLYMCTNSGVDWVVVYDVVSEASWFAQFALIFFVTFFNFAVLNILSGIFLEKAMRNSEPDREAMALEKRRMDLEDGQALRALFHQLDWEGNGVMSLQEFECHLNDDKVQGYLAALGIDATDAKMFFDVLCHVNGNDDLLIEDFVDHCSHIKGNASATDMASLSYEVKLLRREVKEGLCIATAAGDDVTNPYHSRVSQTWAGQRKGSTTVVEAVKQNKSDSPSLPVKGMEADAPVAFELSPKLQQKLHVIKSDASTPITPPILASVPSALLYEIESIGSEA